MTTRDGVTRRSFVLGALSAAAIAALPWPRAMGLRKGSALRLGAHDRAVLVAAVDTLVPAETVVTARGALALPAASEAGAVEFIERLLAGEVFGPGVRRPDYVKLPDGVVAEVIGSQPPVWHSKRRGWSGSDGAGGELARLRRLYADGLADLDRRTVPVGFVNSSPAVREATLRLVQGEETSTFNGKGERDQPFLFTLMDHICQACFGDPAYGGNRDWVYWDALNHPGPAFAHLGGPGPGQGWTAEQLAGPLSREWR